MLGVKEKMLFMITKLKKRQCYFSVEYSVHEFIILKNVIKFSFKMFTKN